MRLLERGYADVNHVHWQKKDRRCLVALTFWGTKLLGLVGEAVVEGLSP